MEGKVHILVRIAKWTTSGSGNDNDVKIKYENTPKNKHSSQARLKQKS